MNEKIELLKYSIEMLNATLSCAEFEQRSKLIKTAFCRNRKLGFKNTMSLSLNFLSRPIFSELNNYFDNIIGKDSSVRQQSFSEARQKIKYEAFQELYYNTAAISLLAQDAKLYANFRLLAIDGSLVQLKNTAELKEAFGEKTPCEGKVFARASCVVDVLNDVVLEAQLVPFREGERVTAKRQIEHLRKMNVGKVLFLMDRGYWSPELFTQILAHGDSFLVRVPNGVNLQVKSGAEEITINHENRAFKLRCKRFSLPSGEIETLVTNLQSAELHDDEMMDLYATRWGIETKYNELKNILKMGAISSKTYLTVMQDFYACMMLSNYVTFASYVADDQIALQQQGKDNKYKYKSNRNVLVSSLKNYMIAAVITDSPNQRNAIIECIFKFISQRPVPIRPGRSFPRPSKTSLRKKYPPKSIL